MKYNIFQFLENKIFFNENIFQLGKYKKFKVIKTHKNNTSVIYFKKKGFFRKLSNSKSGIEKIKSEYKGINWYLKKIKKKSKKIILDYKINSDFAYIDLKEIKGKKIKSWNSFKENYNYLIKVIKLYNRYFLIEKLSYIHGDLTFDNIIFEKKNLHIIDWEFFGGDKSVKGYDITYLVLSAACLPHITGKKFTKEDEKLFSRVWLSFINKKFNKKMLLNPFIFFKKKIKSDPILSKSYRLSKSKFFPFITDKQHQKKILKIIHSLNYEK